MFNLSGIFCCGQRKNSRDQEDSKEQLNKNETASEDDEAKPKKPDPQNQRFTMSASASAAAVNNLEFSDYIVFQEQNLKTFSFKEWRQIVDQDINLQLVSHTQLRYSLRQGIPDELRPRIWCWMANVPRMQKFNQNLYAKLRQTKCKYDDQILKDVPRTYSELDFFQSERVKNQLFNILRAYSNFDKDVGYMQGINYVVASIMLVLRPDNYENVLLSFGHDVASILMGEEEQIDEDAIDYIIEEKTFWILVYICIQRNWRLVYKEGLQELKVQLRYLDKLIKERLPEVHEHIKRMNVSLLACFTEVYVTALLMNSPFELCPRILDSFLLEGDKILFEIIIRLMKITQKEILEKNDMEQTLNFLKYEMMAQGFKTYGSQLIPQAHSSEMAKSQPN